MLVPVYLSLRLYSVGKLISLKLRRVRRGLVLCKSDKADKRNFASILFSWSVKRRHSHCGDCLVENEVHR